MAKKIPGWLLGCGIGCGVLLLGAILLGVAGAFWMRGMLRGFDDAVEARARIEERFGTAGEFTPAADGSIPASRMEAFLAVREALGPPRREIAAIFAGMPLSKEAAEELDRKPDQGGPSCRSASRASSKPGSILNACWKRRRASGWFPRRTATRPRPW